MMRSELEFFERIPDPCVPLEAIDRDDGAVELNGEVVMGRDLVLYLPDRSAVEPRVWNRRTYPGLLPELRQRGPCGDEPDAVRPAALRGYRACLEGFPNPASSAIRSLTRF